MNLEFASIVLVGANAQRERAVMTENFHVLNQQTQGKIATLHTDTTTNLSKVMDILRAELDASNLAQDRFQRGNYSVIERECAINNARLAVYVQCM